MGQVSQANPSIGAAIVPGEAADAAATPSPPDLLPAPASTPAGAVADSPAEPPVVSDVGMVEAPPLVVIPDLPILSHEERAAAVAEVDDRRPSTRGGDGARRVDRRGIRRLGGGARRTAACLGEQRPHPHAVEPHEWRGQPLWFWSRGASELLLFLNDEREEQCRNELREYAEATMRSLRATMETLSRDVPRVIQVRI
jgi:hypothetical protein